MAPLPPRGALPPEEQSAIGTQHSNQGRNQAVSRVTNVKTILPQPGGNEMVSGATTGAFRRMAEGFE
jgi:hypothetical protein